MAGHIDRDVCYEQCLGSNNTGHNNLTPYCSRMSIAHTHTGHSDSKDMQANSGLLYITFKLGNYSFALLESKG